MESSTKTRENRVRRQLARQGFRLHKKESELAERANELDMDLRQDSDGFYWLDFLNQPDMRSLGPFDLDEVADRITAAENGFIGNQIEDYMENLEG